MPNFCSETFDSDKALELIVNVGDRLSVIYLGNSSGDYESIIGQMALAREALRNVEELKNLLLEASLKGFMCTIINKYDLESELQQIELKFDQLTNLIEEFDNKVSAIEGGNLSFSDVESQIESLFGDFEPQKEQLFSIVKQFTKDALSPLTAIGASETDINTAVEDVPFTTDVKAFVEGIFTSLLDDALARIDN